jgi:hypothetical protein
MTVYTEAALQPSEAAAFLAGFDDDFVGVLAVGVGSWVLAVLFATVFAAVALSAVGRVAVFDEVFVVAVWAGQGLGDRHKSFYNHPLPALPKHGIHGYDQPYQPISITAIFLVLSLFKPNSLQLPHETNIFSCLLADDSVLQRSIETSACHIGQ